MHWCRNNVVLCCGTNSGVVPRATPVAMGKEKSTDKAAAKLNRQLYDAVKAVWPATTLLSPLVLLAAQRRCTGQERNNHNPILPNLAQSCYAYGGIPSPSPPMAACMST